MFEASHKGQCKAQIIQCDRRADRQTHIRALCLEWQWRNVHMTWPRWHVHLLQPRSNLSPWPTCTPMLTIFY